MAPFISRLLAAAVLIGLLLPASPAFTEEHPDEADPEPTSESDDEPPYEREANLLAKASEITEKVAQIRGLPQLEPIKKGVQDRDQLRAMLIERLQQETSPEDFEREARVFRRLGLFEPDLDYQKLMLDLLTEQIAGFYDQSRRELYIMEGLPASLQEPTMAHEIFHALQDQHFDIGRLLAPDLVDDNDDFTLARMALIEGDATVLMIDYELYGHGLLPQGDRVSIADMPGLAAMLMELDTAEMSAVDQLADDDAMDLGGDAVPSLTDSVLGSAPPIIRDALLFPYIEGMRFVLRARAGRTWEEFDAIYDNAPLTTSQIFNPESFFDGPEPLDIRFSAQAPMGDDPVYDNAFGELQVRSWLRTHHTEEASYDPDEAARGLRGDRIRAYPLNPDADDESILVAHLSSWDSQDQARQFATALESTARDRHAVDSHHSEGTHGEGWCLRHGDGDEGERLLIERWGDMVLYIEGAPSHLDEEGRETDATTFQVRQSVWESHRRQPLREVLDHRDVDLQSPSPSSASTTSINPLSCH